MKRFCLLILVAVGLSCSGSGVGGGGGGAATGSPGGAVASVTGVAVSGAPGAYQLDVTVESPDTGCSQYADWWEVVRPNGELVYRRILAHSHKNEQPFTRSGGPVNIDPDERVIVRAHMAGGAGYGGTAYSGSPSVGFSADDSIGPDWNRQLAKADPRPGDCQF